MPLLIFLTKTTSVRFYFHSTGSHSTLEFVLKFLSWLLGPSMVGRPSISQTSHRPTPPIHLSGLQVRDCWRCPVPVLRPVELWFLDGDSQNLEGAPFHLRSSDSEDGFCSNRLSRSLLAYDFMSLSLFSECVLCYLYLNCEALCLWKVLHK